MAALLFAVCVFVADRRDAEREHQERVQRAAAERAQKRWDL
jgi:hypothetical protein